MPAPVFTEPTFVPPQPAPAPEPVVAPAFEETESLMGVAQQANPFEQYALGQKYLIGDGVPQDFVAAGMLIQLAAENGNPEAQFSLAELCTRGQGVPQNYAESFVWFHKAAEQDHVGAQFTLATKYELGEGVPQDYGAAAQIGRAHV